MLSDDPLATLTNLCNKQIDKGCLINQPGLQIINTVAILTKNWTLTILVDKNTNKLIRFIDMVCKQILQVFKII